MKPSQFSIADLIRSTTLICVGFGLWSLAWYPLRFGITAPVLTLPLVWLSSAFIGAGLFAPAHATRLGALAGGIVGLEYVLWTLGLEFLFTLVLMASLLAISVRATNRWVPNDMPLRKVRDELRDRDELRERDV